MADNIEISIQLNVVGNAEILINDVAIMCLGPKGVHRYILSTAEKERLVALGVPFVTSGAEGFWRILDDHSDCGGIL